jgi:hypothetical protein
MSARVASRRWRTARRLTVAALAWSMGLVLAAVALPVYSTSSTSATDGVTLTHSTLVAVNGVRALVLMAIPALATLTVLWAIRARRAGAPWGGPLAWTAVAILAAECVLGILTIGAFILPAAVLLAVAVRLAPGHERAHPASPTQARLPGDPGTAGT